MGKKIHNLLTIYKYLSTFILQTRPHHSFEEVNCDSVTPAPMAAVDEIPPVTVLRRLST